MMKSRLVVVLFLLIFILACQTRTVPKPRGYFRIDLPEKKYSLLDQAYPFNFLVPDYGVVNKYEGTMSASEETDNWLNIDFPELKAHLYLTFKAVDSNLGSLIEDAHSFVYKHVSMADAINQIEFVSNESSVFGLLFDIKGNTATALQFYVTDSISNFLRGALYFDCEPNRDSLNPLIDFLKEDIEVLMESFTWI